MSITGKYHQKYVYSRRVEVLARHIAPLIPQNAKVLDIGCGDGLISSIISNMRKDISITGVDVLMRGKSYIEVRLFDGRTLPFENNEFNVVLFIDVLHHTTNQLELLEEAKRVASDVIIIKDHLNNNWFDNQLLIFMDKVGNRRFGVNLTFQYLSLQHWKKAFKDLDLTISTWLNKLRLYQFPLGLMFDRNLHFITTLRKTENHTS